MNENLETKLTFNKLAAESWGIHCGNIIQHSDIVDGSGSGIERSRRFCIQMIIHWNDSMVVNHGYLIIMIWLLTIQ